MFIQLRDIEDGVTYSFQISRDDAKMILSLQSGAKSTISIGQIKRNGDRVIILYNNGNTGKGIVFANLDELIEQLP